MEKKNIIKKRIAEVVLITAIITAFFVIPFFNRDEKEKNNMIDLEKISKKKHNKLMIVAHPDDEVLWGGLRLIEEDYVVVCVTCGENPRRLNEIKSVLSKTGDELIYLGVRDKIHGIRNDMKKEKENIERQLERIVKKKNWTTIVTHNASGEYGHIHHKIVHKIVTETVVKNNKENELYYFGRYCSKSNIDKDFRDAPKIDDKKVIEKIELLKLYYSQKDTIEGLSHMIPYENWQKYNLEAENKTIFKTLKHE